MVLIPEKMEPWVFFLEKKNSKFSFKNSSCNSRSWIKTELKLTRTGTGFEFLESFPESLSQFHLCVELEPELKSRLLKKKKPNLR
jgi:hypothetical protein